VTDLLRHADIAMYHAKQTGKGHYRFFLNEMESGARERVLLETAMRDGLDRDEFEVHFQPRVRLNDGAIVSAEALVRWRHPRRGLIPPDRFVPLAEATNLIHPLGRKVLEMACFQATSWPATPDGRVPNVSVNLSRHQLQRSDIVDEIAMVLQASGLAPGRFEVEVVETGAMSDVQETARTLSRLRDLGVRIALDDFGTGHSSLGWLQRLPVDVLKLDRTFIARIGDGPSVPGGTDDEAILRAILQLGHALDLTLVAEGIETVAQYRLLRDLGCDEAQGWLFAKPMPGNEIRARIAGGSLALPSGASARDPLRTES
jgi:predicted signal transduction protein with EAL and GGDEF domain